MRPVAKGDSPVNGKFNNYRQAFPYLLKTIGIGVYKGFPLAQYCSYCERAIPTNLAVEHIEPKDGDFGKPHLEKEWSNFLLACVNCNSHKGSIPVDFNELYLPDRDNTFYAITYTLDGHVLPSCSLNNGQKKLALKTITLVGLNKSIITDIDGVAIDRREQRISAFGIALDSLEDYEANPNNPAMGNMLLKSMLSTGFFSIWMDVFSKYPKIRNQFIRAITGTKESGCFDLQASATSPHPNSDKLLSGGKI